jgi:hypothetical protein
MCKKNDMLRKKKHIRKRVAKKTYQEKAKIFTFFPFFSKLFSARLSKIGGRAENNFFFRKKNQQEKKFWIIIKFILIFLSFKKMCF